MKSIYIKNCDHSAFNVIRILDNSSFYLDENCNAFSSVCVEYDEFKEAMVKISFC